VSTVRHRLAALWICTATVSAAAGEPLGSISFRDIAIESGVRFRFENGARGKHDLPEIMGGGVGLLDVDGDGRLDIFYCNGGPIGDSPDRSDPPCRLYRNTGDGNFLDITAAAGAPGPSYAMGVAVGDHDGDGRDDLFVTGWRDQRLYRNRGGRFDDVTVAAGLCSGLWSTSAAFADLDGDGDLDLYVANYLDYDATRAPFCAAPDGRRDYCGPEVFAAQPDRLYRNNGNGTFTDVTAAAGIADTNGRGLGVLIADLTGDGRLDIYVANDGTPCYLFRNEGDLRFSEVGLQSGVALDTQGSALAAMGIAYGDLDGDGRAELAVGNLFGRSTVIFTALGAGAYQDSSSRWALPAATRALTGFGLALTDFDGDGRLDLIQASGHVLDRARLGTPCAMPTVVLRNTGRRLENASATAGDWFAQPILGRGLAIGDLDGDGRPDAVINAIDSPAGVLRNASANARYVGIRLIGRAPACSAAIGAVVRARVGGTTLVHQVTAGGSYLSSSARTIFIGLGQAREIDELEVAWPSGRVERWKRIAGPGGLTLREGDGRSRDTTASGADARARQGGSIQVDRSTRRVSGISSPCASSSIGSPSTFRTSPFATTRPPSSKIAR
jgi:hypothetical protein